MSGNECFFFGILFKRYIQKQYFNNVPFYPELITRCKHPPPTTITTVEFLLSIKSQFTTNPQSFLQLNKYTKEHAWSWTVESCNRFWGCDEWFYKRQECVGEVPFNF